MLDALKKKLGIAPTTEDVEMRDKNVQTTASVDLSEFDALKLAVAEKSADLEAATKLLDEVQAELLASREAAKMAVQEVKSMKLAARKAVVEGIIGTEKASSFLSATESLDDSAFSNIVSSLSQNVKAEENTSAFKELGVDAKADASSIETQSEEMKLLKKKYQEK